jgi:hypothetical protein
MRLAGDYWVKCKIPNIGEFWQIAKWAPSILPGVNIWYIAGKMETYTDKSFVEIDELRIERGRELRKPGWYWCTSPMTGREEPTPVWWNGEGGRFYGNSWVDEKFINFLCPIMPPDPSSQSSDR